MQEVLLSKRDLITLSHALEDVLPQDAGEHAVIALFQRGAHFEVEAESYQALARSAGTVVVGFVEGDDSEVPDGVTAVDFEDGSRLASLWALAIVGPGTSGALVCEDLGGLVDGMATDELDRQFRATWTFHRHEAAQVAEDLVGQLGDRLPAETAEGLRRAIKEALAVPVDDREAAMADAFGRMLQALERGDRALRRSRRALAGQTVRAEQDELTGAANRHGLRRAIAELAPDGRLHNPVGAMLIDLDRFKDINDQHGHEAGDRVLVAVAERVRRQIRPHDLLVRFGGDEFLVLLPGADRDALEMRAGAVAGALSAMDVEGIDRPVSASVGADLIAELPLDLTVVDSRMYLAKETRSGER